MPQVVAPLAAAFGAFIGGLTISGTAALIATGVATFVLGYVVPSIALSAVSKLLAPRRGALNGVSPIQLVRGPVEFRRVVYGEVRVGGTLLDAFEGGLKNEFAHLVVGHAGHECESIGTVWFNDEAIPFDGAGVATGTLAGLARIRRHLGGAGQAADADYVAESAGARSATDRFSAICYSYLRLKFDQAKFPGGLPNISVLLRGRKVFDPRSGLTAWSANPALVVRDFLSNADFGLGIDAAEIDDATISAAANVCDESVALAAGGAEARYQLHGTFERGDDLEPGQILESMLGTFAGTLVYVGGKWQLHAGAWQPPTITLTEGDLRGPIDVQPGLSIADTANGVRAKWTSPQDNYQPVDATPITNATYLAEDLGVRSWRNLDLPWVTSHGQAQRLAKIELERTRQGITARLPCKLSALRAQAGCTILLTNAELGWVAKPFVVERLKFAPTVTEDNVTLDVDLFVRETAAAVWDWNLGDETTYDPAPNTTLRDPRFTPTPTGLVLSTVPIIQPDGAVMPRLRAQWDLPADHGVLAGGLVEVEFRLSTSADWLPWNGNIRPDATEEIVTDVQAGLAYDVRVRFRNHFAVAGAWASAQATVATFAGPPANPAPASKSGEGVRLGTDGHAASYLEFSVPALPTGAVRQSLLFRVGATAEWSVSTTLVNLAPVTARIEGLVPGQSYSVATRAESLNATSAVIDATAAPFSAPSDTTIPVNITNCSFVAGDTTTSLRPPPSASGPGGTLMFAATIKWTPSVSRDAAFVDFIVTGVDSDGAADFGYDLNGPTVRALANATTASLYQVSNTDPAFVRARVYDHSFNRSGWVSCGNAQPFLKLPSGDLIEQNAANVDLTGGKVALPGLSAGVTTATDITGVNLRVFNAFGIQQMRVDAVTGEVYVQFQKVLSTRVSTTPATLADVISVLQHHGLSQ